MYQNIQNVACIELFLDQKDNRFRFSKDILSGKKVKSVFIMGRGNDYVPLSPYTNIPLTEITYISRLSLYLNLVDVEGNQIIKNFILDNSIISLDNIFPPVFFTGKEIDLDKSYLSIMNNQNVYYPVKLLMYVIYDTTDNVIVDRVVKGTETVKINFTSNIQDKRLSDFINFDLQDKKIKKITVHSETFDILPVYFDIVCTNGYRLENIPTYFLRRMAELEIYLNNLIIDPENSYLRFRNNMELSFKNDISFIF